MEIGTELSKTVATFIIQKILLDDNGLNHICATAARFYAVKSHFQYFQLLIDILFKNV
jgi:CCR4-NOT transcription complex subunit 9